MIWGVLLGGMLIASGLAMMAGLWLEQCREHAASRAPAACGGGAGARTPIRRSSFTPPRGGRRPVAAARAGAAATLGGRHG